MAAVPIPRRGPWRSRSARRPSRPTPRPSSAPPPSRRRRPARRWKASTSAGSDSARATQYSAGLSFSQNVFSGGRISGQNAAAAATRRSAEVEVVAQRAQLALDVTQAYFDAVLADRLVTIADTTLSQTEELLRQTTVARRVGNQSEFELLRATVTRDNQRPVLIARRGDRDVAYLRLKQLLNLPLDEPLALTTPIDEPTTITRVIAANAANVSGTAPSVIDTLAPLPAPDTTTSDRAPVRQSEEALRARRGSSASRAPSACRRSRSPRSYQRLFFPNNFLPTLNQFSENWTVGGSLSLSLFNGGRVGGAIEVAQANLDGSARRGCSSRASSPRSIRASR